MTGWFLGVPHMSSLSTDRTFADDALLTKNEPARAGGRGVEAGA
jgi:hypothetical protein